MCLMLDARTQTPGNFNDTFETGSYTVLGMAVSWNSKDAVAACLEAGADPTVPYVCGHHALHVCNH